MLIFVLGDICRVAILPFINGKFGLISQPAVFRELLNLPLRLEYYFCCKTSNLDDYTVNKFETFDLSETIMGVISDLRKPNFAIDFYFISSKVERFT